MAHFWKVAKDGKKDAEHLEFYRTKRDAAQRVKELQRSDRKATKRRVKVKG